MGLPRPELDFKRGVSRLRNARSDPVSESSFYRSQKTLFSVSGFPAGSEIALRRRTQKRLPCLSGFPRLSQNRPSEANCSDSGHCYGRRGSHALRRYRSAARTTKVVPSPPGTPRFDRRPHGPGDPVVSYLAWRCDIRTNASTIRGRPSWRRDMPDGRLQRDVKPLSKGVSSA